jgi:hypothetical protein
VTMYVAMTNRRKKYVPPCTHMWRFQKAMDAFLEGSGCAS